MTDITNKYLVFSSVGDNTNFHNLWINNDRIFDIYVIYYGNSEINYLEYQKKVDFIEKHQGSKFQNFYYFYQKYPEIIDKYQRFFILDDDIIITTENINKSFELSEKFNLEICGPSLSHDSKISHYLTEHKNNVILSYTNFVEVNVPLFSKEALGKFMKNYDPCLIGFGIDFLAIWSNDINKRKSYAILHCVVCKNPKDHEKKNTQREITTIKNFKTSEQIWKEHANKLGCPYRYPLKIYENLPLSKSN